MTEAADALDCNQVAGKGAAVAQRVVGGDAGAQQRRCVHVFEAVGDGNERLDGSDHVLLIAAVVADAGDLLIAAIDKIAAAALATGVVVAAMPADAGTLALLPGSHTATDFINDPRHFMSWNAGILDSGPRAFDGERVAVADATGLDFDPHLSRAGRGDCAFDDLETGARFANLRGLHRCCCDCSGCHTSSWGLSVNVENETCGDGALLCDLENDLELNGHAEGKAGDADDQTYGIPVGAEYIAEQVRGAVGNRGLIEKIAMGCDEDAEPDDTGHAVERAEMLFRRSQGTEGRSAGGVSSGCGIEFFAQAAKVFRLVIDNGQHSGEEEQVAGLERLHIGAEGRRRGRKLDAEFREALLGRAPVRNLRAHHRPACAPSSTCSTSPVM